LGPLKNIKACGSQKKNLFVTGKPKAHLSGIFGTLKKKGSFRPDSLFRKERGILARYDTAERGTEKKAGTGEALQRMTEAHEMYEHPSRPENKSRE